MGWLRRSAPVTEQDSPALPDQHDQPLQAPQQSQLPSIISAEQLKNLKTKARKVNARARNLMFDFSAMKYYDRNAPEIKNDINQTNLQVRLMSKQSLRNSKSFSLQ